MAWLGSKTRSHMPEDDADADAKSEDSENLGNIASRARAKPGSPNLS